MKDTTTDARDHEAYISGGTLNNGLKTGSAMLNDAGTEAMIDDAVEKAHDIPNQLTAENDASATGVPAPVMKQNVNGLYYMDLSVDDTTWYFKDSAGDPYTITSAFVYAKGENGFTPITLADNTKLQKSDLAVIDYKLYAIIASDTDYNIYRDESEIIDDSEIQYDTTLD